MIIDFNGAFLSFIIFILFSHCYRAASQFPVDLHGKHYRGDWVPPRGVIRWLGSADPALHHFLSHLPPHPGWAPGHDRADPAGLSSPHAHVLLSQPTRAGGLGLLLSCHSQSDGWIPHRRQNHFLRGLCHPFLLLRSLYHRRKLPLGRNGLWPLCRLCDPLRYTTAMRTRACARLLVGCYFCGSWTPPSTLGTFQALLL